MNLRRRLMDGSAVTEKDAEGAWCSGSKVKSKEFCIADVMATGSLDLAEDEFYLNHEQGSSPPIQQQGLFVAVG